MFLSSGQPPLPRVTCDNRPMVRPDERPMRRLNVLEPRRSTLEKCVFCPKLCRSACPVSNAEPRETLTPWGKMSMAYFIATESVELSRSFADPAWACTGCFGCREQCDHRNDVAATLFDARAGLVETQTAPPAVMRVIDQFDARAGVLRERARGLSTMPEVDASSRTALLLGCAHSRGAESESREAVIAAAEMTGAPVALLDICCGAPLLYAGAKPRFLEQGEQLKAALHKTERLIVVDAGCAATIRVHHASNGLHMPASVEHFSETAMRALGRIQCVPDLGEEPVRYHDACQLGRGLGVYEEPRALLAQLLGHAPEEFVRHHQEGQCSGAGGLLPSTMPEIASRITRERIREHQELGGGTIVTTCASSLLAFRKQGGNAIHLISLVARGLRAHSR